MEYCEGAVTAAITFLRSVDLEWQHCLIMHPAEKGGVQFRNTGTVIFFFFSPSKTHSHRVCGPQVGYLQPKSQTSISGQVDPQASGLTAESET